MDSGPKMGAAPASNGAGPSYTDDCLVTLGSWGASIQTNGCHLNTTGISAEPKGKPVLFFGLDRAALGILLCCTCPVTRQALWCVDPAPFACIKFTSKLPKRERALVGKVGLQGFPRHGTRAGPGLPCTLLPVPLLYPTSSPPAKQQVLLLVPVPRPRCWGSPLEPC